MKNAAVKLKLIEAPKPQKRRARAKKKKPYHAQQVVVQTTAELNRNEANAADILIAAKEKIKACKLQQANCTESQVIGRVQEIDHAATLNANLARKGIHDVRAVPTKVPGRAETPGDIKIERRVDGRWQTEKTYEAKFRNSAKVTRGKFTHEKYKGMGRLGPSDQIEEVKMLSKLGVKRTAAKGQFKKAELRQDVADNATAVLEARGETSTPRTLKKAKQITRKPETLAKEGLVSELRGAAKKGALVGAGVSAAVSGFANAKAYKDGKISGKEAIVNTAIDGVKGGAVGLTVGVAQVGVRQGLVRMGCGGLANGSLPGMIVTGAIDCGAGVKKYLNDEISGKELGQHVKVAAGRTVGGWAGFEAGAALGTLIPVPVVGTLVGGLIGGLLGAAFGEGFAS